MLPGFPEHAQYTDANTLASQGLFPQGSHSIATTGNYEGISYKIDYRDSNSLLAVSLPPGALFKGKPGAMVAMDGTVQIKGKVWQCPSSKHIYVTKFFLSSSSGLSWGSSYNSI